MFKLFSKKDQFETAQFDFIVKFANGTEWVCRGWYNPNSLNPNEERSQIIRYLEEEFPHREFVIKSDYTLNKGLCVQSFDMMSWNKKYKNDPIKAYLPIWDEKYGHFVFKVA